MVKNLQHTVDKRSMRVLVELDILAGLPADIDILCNDFFHVQNFDYLNVPFWCQYFHLREHIRYNYPTLLHRSP